MPEILPETTVSIYIANTAGDFTLAQELHAALQAHLPAQTLLLPLRNSPLPSDEDRPHIEVFVPLISPEYINYSINPYNNQRFQHLFKRADRRQTLFCPVLLRECDWSISDFRRFRMLPIPSMNDGVRPITESSWGSRQVAWSKVISDLQIYISFMLEYKPVLTANITETEEPMPKSELEENPDLEVQISSIIPSEIHFAYRRKVSQFPMRIGFLAADMTKVEGDYWLQDPEWQELNELSQRNPNKFQVIPLPSLEKKSLFEFLLLQRIHILHFSAWSGEDNLLLPPDPRMQGNTEEVLNKTMRFFSNQIDAVVMSGCYNPDIYRAVEAWVSNVIGTYSVTPQDMALPFTRQLYNELMQEREFGDAFRAARSLVHPRFLPSGRQPFLYQKF